MEHTISWFLPEGTYLGTLVEAGIYTQPTTRGEKRYFRLVFDTEESDVFRTVYAQKRYEIRDGWKAKLTKDLEKWFGHEFVQMNAGFDHQSLIGNVAKLKVKNFHNARHNKPYCAVTTIRPLSPKQKVIIAQRQMLHGRVAA
jgi:hypothetical protein